MTNESYICKYEHIQSTRNVLKAIFTSQSNLNSLEP